MRINLLEQKMWKKILHSYYTKAAGKKEVEKLIKIIKIECLGVLKDATINPGAFFSLEKYLVLTKLSNLCVTLLKTLTVSFSTFSVQ